MPHWLFHLLGGDGGSVYDYLSAPLPDVALITGVAAFIHRHQCHDHRCVRIARHQVANGEFAVCGRHHRQLNGLPANHRVDIHHIKTVHDATTR